MTLPVQFDVAVVGAGPAGSSAALALSRGGMRVAILEKAFPPRHKTCGGGVLGRALAQLPVDVSAAVERECEAAALHHHGPDLAFNTRRTQPIVSMVMRDRFDHTLTLAAQAAGAELFPGEPVCGVTIMADQVKLRTGRGEFTAGYVIAADGAGSVVARQCGLPELRRLIPALECEVSVAAPCFEKFSRAARFDFGLTPHGYAWVFPKREHLSIGVLTTRRGSCNLNEEYRRYLARLGIDDFTEMERHGYMIPIQPRDRMFDAPRILLAGDAAGLVDPVTAEGISAAILSGQLAAQAVLNGQALEAETRRAYRRLLEADLLPELRVARVLARVLYDFPRVRAWLLTRHGQRLSEFLTRIVMGESSYRAAVRRPGNYLRLLGRKLTHQRVAPS